MFFITVDEKKIRKNKMKKKKLRIFAKISLNTVKTYAKRSIDGIIQKIAKHQ